MQDIKSEVRPETAIRIRGGGVLVPAEWADNVRATNERIDAILRSES